MQKRLFFGLEVSAPWPDPLPRGRLLDPACRHMTLAFLGNIPYEPLLDILPDVPRPSFTLGPTGHFDGCLFLPPRRPNVVAWHVDWFEGEPLLHYQKQLLEWLRGHHYSLDERLFLSHVTLARWPFDRDAWAKLPYVLPVVGQAIHLYESMGNLHYESRWSHALTPPFEPISHTADIAFTVRGNSLTELLHHARLALAFECPRLLPYFQEEHPSTHEDVIMLLNQLIARADAAEGIPLKAVSYHGEIAQRENLLEWEMIVDV